MFIRHASRSALAAAALGLLCGAGVASSLTKVQDSVTYQVNPAHTGVIDFAGGFAPPLQQVWSVDLGGSVSYPLTGNGMVFVTVGGNSVTFLDALDITTGATVWQKLLPGSTSWADAAYDNGTVFVINGSGALTAFRAKSGKKLWSVQLQGYQYYGAAFSAPAAGNGEVVVQYENTNYNDSVVAFDEATGAAKWSTSPGSYTNTGVTGLAAWDDNGLFIGANNSVLQLSPVDGSTIWSNPANCGVSDTNVLAYGKVYASRTSCGFNSILNEADGTSLGSFAGSSAPVILSKKSLLVSLNGTLYAYSPKNENVYWSFTGDSSFNVKPLVINGIVVALSSYDGLYLLDGATGAQLWSTSLGYSYNYGGPDTGLGAGEGVLLVPTGTTLTALSPSH
jgi:outer membrane protein assembly factor BamB